MAFKLAIFPALFALANAGALLGGHYAYAPQPLAYAAPAVAKVAPLAYAAPVAKVATPVLTKHIDEDYDPNPQYSYSYDVQDSITGDNKQQQESRNGDVVQGSYSFIEADGSRRTVDYTADPVNGFNAVVHNEPGVAKIAAAVAPAPIIAKAQPLSYAAPAPVYEKHIAYAAPAQQLIAKPLAYAAPAQFYAKPLAYAAPAPALAYGAPLTKYIH